MTETYTNLLQWLVMLAFLLLIIGFMLVEAFWLSRKGWASFGKAFAFSALSDLIGFFVSFVVVFISIVALLPLVFNDTASKNSRFNTIAIMIIGIFAILFTPVFLMICKRIFLGVLKIQTGKPAWFYALASSVLIVIVSLGVPTLIEYFIF